MICRPPIPTRTYTLCPYTTRVRSLWCRLGGNEFGFFERRNNGLSDALQIVQRINGALAAPCRLSDLQISVDCAIGCALSGHEEEELEDVLRQAQEIGRAHV